MRSVEFCFSKLFFFECHRGEKESSPPELYSFVAYRLCSLIQDRAQVNQNYRGAQEGEIKQNNTQANTWRGGDTTKQGAPRGLELHRRAQAKPRHCTIDAIEKHRGNQDCTTTRHHLCHGVHSNGHPGRDDATALVCHRRSQMASPSRELHRAHPKHHNKGHHGRSNCSGEPRLNHDTAPSTQSKSTGQPRLHNAATPPVSWGTFERSRRAETTPRHLCATGVVEGHHQA